MFISLSVTQDFYFNKNRHSGYLFLSTTYICTAKAENIFFHTILYVGFFRFPNLLHSINQVYQYHIKSLFYFDHFMKDLGF